jgi:hypothetical protein
MKVAALFLALGVAVAGFAADSTYKGYLADTYCGAKGHGGMDGADLVNSPGDHTVACQVACAKGGYGVMLKDGMTYKYVPFDAKGSELAAQVLKTTKKEKGPKVVVTGSLEKGTLRVASLVEDTTM